MNQWHATLTNAFGEQPEPVGVLGGGSHNVTAITVTTYDSAYRYINEYGDQFGLLVVDEEHHLPAPTYRQIPEMTIAPYRLGLTATYERPDGKHELLEELLGPVVYRENVDELAGEYLSEYETIHMSVDLTADEGETYDEEYQLYRDYVDSHEFDLWKEDGYAEFLKRTSYDPQGRRALIAKQRAERIARTAAKKLDTLDNLIKRHHDDRAIIFTANNDFAYDISQEFIVPCITTRPRLTNARDSGTVPDGEYSMLVTSRCLTRGSTCLRRTSGSSSRGVPRNASTPSGSAGYCGPRMIANRHASTKSSRTRRWRPMFPSAAVRGECVVLTANLARSRTTDRRSQTVVHRSD